MAAFVLCNSNKEKTNDTLWFTICLNVLANFEEKLTLNDVVVGDETIQT